LGVDYGQPPWSIQTIKQEIEMSKTYRLGSSPLVFAPGFVGWAINGYRSKKDRPTFEAMISDGWEIPISPARALLSGAAPFTVEGDVVVFTFDGATAEIGDNARQVA
jgi:hypothetical protein